MISSCFIIKKCFTDLQKIKNIYGCLIGAFVVQVGVSRSFDPRRTTVQQWVATWCMNNDSR
jgi:hypothetical protein